MKPGNVSAKVHVTLLRMLWDTKKKSSLWCISRMPLLPSKSSTIFKYAHGKIEGFVSMCNHKVRPH